MVLSVVEKASTEVVVLAFPVGFRGAACASASTWNHFSSFERKIAFSALPTAVEMTSDSLTLAVRLRAFDAALCERCLRPVERALELVLEDTPDLGRIVVVR